jgi:hypothetical protein
MLNQNLKKINDMEDKKQTALEWFAERIQSDKIFSFERVLEKAKAMEKQQHGETWNAAIDAHDKRGGNIARSFCDFDDYYEETYSKIS